MTRRHAAIAAKALVSAALVAWLASRIEIGPFARRFAGIDLAWLGLALALFLAQLLLTGWRYALIGRAIAAPLPAGVALRLMLIAQFFSQTLPSAIGGDVVRAVMAQRHGLSWGRAISAVLCDRGIAMVVLLAVATLTLPLFHARIDASWARLTMTALAAGSVLGLALLALADDDRLAWLGRLSALRPFLALIADLRRVAFAAPESRRIVPISLVVYASVITTVWMLARALGLATDFVDCLLLVPPIVLTTVAPISIAGWGVREGAMVVGFGLVGMAEGDALALSVLIGLAQIAIGIPGGIVWLRGERATPRAPDAAA